MSYSDLRSALRARLTSALPGASVVIAPNLPASQVPPFVHVRQIMFQRGETARARQFAETTRRGFVHLALGYPINTGIAQAQADVEAIEKEFYNQRDSDVHWLEIQPFFEPDQRSESHYVAELNLHFIQYYLVERQ